MCRQASNHVPALKKGDTFEVNNVKDQIDSFSLGNLVKSIHELVRQYTATTRQVHTGDLVTFKQRQIQLDLPTGTYVLIFREGWDDMFYLGG